MKRKNLSVHMALGIFLFGLAGPLAPPSAAASSKGEVTLPLQQYLALLERIDRAQEAATDNGETEIFAELLSQRLEVRIEDEIVHYTAHLEVEVRGRAEKAVPLPFPTSADTGSIEPATGAALHRRQDGGTALAVSKEGSYRVTLSGRRSLLEGNGGWSLPLGSSRAPVASIEVDLAAGLAWACEGAVVVSETQDGARRRLHLAPLRGKAHELRLHRDLEGSTADLVFARAVVVTLAELTALGTRRHDVVHYEVQRGELERLEVELPAGLVPQTIGTDEGEADVLLKGDTLVVPRQQRLTKSGYLYLTAPMTTGDLSLAPILPAVETRARYLVTVSSIAAESRPLPESGWMLVDLEDLPSALQPSIQAMKPTSVWRRLGGEESDVEKLEILRLPEVAKEEVLIERRETFTLLTVDGTLVHRELLSLRGERSALDFDLPPGATLWSTTVDGVAVRPVERGGRFAIPLSFAGGRGAMVEIIAVQERALSEGRSRLRMELPEVDLPVLEHSWQLLLPENHRYRFAGGTLQPADPVREPIGYPSLTGSSEDSLRRTGSARIQGRVLMEDGSGGLPGATVIATSEKYAGSRAVVTDEEGHYQFLGLPAGRYQVRAQLEGFNPVVRFLHVGTAGVASADFKLYLATLTEEIVLSAESPGSSGLTQKDRLRANEARAENLYLDQAVQLQQGLVGGVKPLKVEIPRSGKALFLAGALPPRSVGVELEVRGR